MEPISLKNKKKMRNTLFISFFVLLMLLGRIGYIEFIKGKELQNLAYEQQVQKRSVSPKRGKIYDSTQKYILAPQSSNYKLFRGDLTLYRYIFCGSPVSIVRRKP